jgi:hypothetical protein
MGFSTHAVGHESSLVVFNFDQSLSCSGGGKNMIESGQIGSFVREKKV